MGEAALQPHPDIDEGLLERLCTLLHVEPTRIRLDKSFIRNGGDSLLAIRFSNVIHDALHVRVGAGAILRAKQLGSLLDKREIKQLVIKSSVQPSHNDDSQAVASEPNSTDDKTLDPIQRFPKVIPTAGLPITFIQAGTAHYTHLIPGAAVQHTTQYCFTDVLPQLKKAFTKVMSSYQVFRIKFEVETSPLLVKTSLKESFDLNWTEVQVESLEEANLEDSIRVWSIEASSEPVFRVLTPKKTSGDRQLSILHWFYHASLMDGKSLAKFMQHVDAFMDDPSLLLEINDNTFETVKDLADYQGQHKVAAKAFWATREVPIGSRNHPLLQALGSRSSSRVRMRSITVSYPEDLKIFQSRTGFTFEVLVRAAMGLVLSKLQNTSTISLMSVSSRRSLPISGIEEMMGSCASSLILTIDINEDDTVHGLLEQVFHKVLELDEMSYSDPSDGFSLGGLVVISSDIQPHTPWYSGGNRTEFISPKETLPTLYVGPTGQVRFTFNSEWRTPSEMQIMTDLFRTALASLGSGAMGVGECLRKMIPNSQTEAILEWGNCISTKTTLEGINDDIMTLFQIQVQDRGDAAALQFRGQQISYKDLSNKVRRVGRWLRALLEPGSVVLLHADASINWVVAMFAVLGADCIFAPQGVNLPHQLRSQHYAIAQAKAFLIPQEDTATMNPDGCQMRLCVETILRDAENERNIDNDKPFSRQPKPLSGAYICFSSGTTGQPKAIRCTHSGIVSLLRDPVGCLHVVPGLRVAQVMAPPFDVALLEAFSTLCSGGTLVLKDPLEPFEHFPLVDSLTITPSLAAELNPEHYYHLKHINFCAEVLPQGIAERWSAGQAIVHNLYGPTECHVLATAQRIRPGQPVTIGKPLLSVRAYILDEQRQLVPPLVAGEIYISGVQVSQGYIGLEEETKFRFVPDTIRPSNDGRMYRTGDWGYWTVDGQIAFIGRTDRQVKLDGFRVDLNDVQARLQNAISSEVRVAAVVVENVLGCAVTGGCDLTPEKVRAAAENALPPQYVPKVIRCLETMPKSMVGKVDYRAVAKLLE